MMGVYRRSSKTPFPLSPSSAHHTGRFAGLNVFQKELSMGRLLTPPLCRPGHGGGRREAQMCPAQPIPAGLQPWLQGAPRTPHTVPGRLSPLWGPRPRYSSSQPWVSTARTGTQAFPTVPTHHQGWPSPFLYPHGARLAAGSLWGSSPGSGPGLCFLASVLAKTAQHPPPGVALFLLHLWPPPASYPGNSSWVPSSWHHQASLRSDTSILSGPLTATPRAGPAPPAPSLPHPTPVALIWGSGLCVTPHCSTYGPRDSIRKKDLWDTKEHGSRAHTGATQLEPLLMENAQQATQAP